MVLYPTSQAAGSDVVSRIPLAGNVTVELTGDDIDTLRRMSIRDSAGRLELLIRLLRVKPEVCRACCCGPLCCDLIC